jgi:hypothetical protein
LQRRQVAGGVSAMLKLIDTGFQKFQAGCTKAGFDLELGVHLRNLVAFATGQSRFRFVTNLKVEALQKAWKEACTGMQFAVNFLKANVGIESPALLASPFMMVVIAYFGHARGYKISPEESAQLRYWSLIANAKGAIHVGPARPWSIRTWRRSATGAIFKTSLIVFACKSVRR